MSAQADRGGSRGSARPSGIANVGRGRGAEAGSSSRGGGRGRGRGRGRGWASRPRVAGVHTSAQPPTGSTADGKKAGRPRADDTSPWTVRAPHPIVDIGVNLGHKRFSKDRDRMLVSCMEANVTELLLTGTSLRSSREVLALAQSNTKLRSGGAKLPVLRSTAGIHPHDAKSASADALQEIRKLCSLAEVVAVGETGLDYNRNFTPPEQQRASFLAHVKMAIELNKPMFLHEREAHADLLSIIDQALHECIKAKAGSTLPPIVVHCFTGTEEEARAYVKRGFYLGFTTFLCKRARGLSGRSILRNGVVPLDRIMLETDAPFMSPDFSGVCPIRDGGQEAAPNSLADGEQKVAGGDIDLSALKQRFQFHAGRNEPCVLPLLAVQVAECLGLTPDTVAKATYENTKKCFRL